MITSSQDVGWQLHLHFTLYNFYHKTLFHIIYIFWQMHFNSFHEHIMLLMHHFYFAWTEYSKKCHIIIQISNTERTAKQFGQICQTVTAVDQSNKSHNASVRHPSMHRSEQKCAHLRSERCTAGRCPAITGGHHWLSVQITLSARRRLALCTLLLQIPMPYQYSKWNGIASMLHPLRPLLLETLSWAWISNNIPQLSVEYIYVTYVMFTFPTRIFYRGVPGFATDCPCGVWCRGLTTCPCMLVHFLEI